MNFSLLEDERSIIFIWNLHSKTTMPQDPLNIMWSYSEIFNLAVRSCWHDFKFDWYCSFLLWPFFFWECMTVSFLLHFLNFLLHFYFLYRTSQHLDLVGYVFLLFLLLLAWIVNKICLAILLIALQRYFVSQQIKNKWNLQLANQFLNFWHCFVYSTFSFKKWKKYLRHSAIGVLISLKA